MPREKNFRNLVSVDYALKIFFASVKDHRQLSERIPIMNSVGRVLAKDIITHHDVPFFDRSVMDGFAIKSVDVANSTQTKPTVLNVIGKIRLGEECRKKVNHLQAISIATGSVMPRGADSVVPIEVVKLASKHRVTLSSPVDYGENILRRGEDFRRGKAILKKGRRIRAQDLGVLRLLGVAGVYVTTRPSVGVISTGSELVENCAPTSKAKTVDINRSVLMAMASDFGGYPMDFGIVQDDAPRIRATLRKALRSCNLILVSGGSSVGERDLIPDCINMLGRPGMLVHGVAMRPGMPTGLAMVNRVPIMSLPGVPVSATLAFRIFGKPMISKLLAERMPENKIKAVLSSNVQGSPGFRCFVRVRLRISGKQLIADPLKTQRSSVLASLVGADGYIVVHERTRRIWANEVVEVILLS